MKLFGTNGIRGIANDSVTPDLAMGIAKSFGTLLGAADKKITIAIGRDTRESGDMLKAAAIAGALSAGCRVVDVGCAPTPTVQYWVRDFADAGIVITASHNPREDNGIKLIAGDGTECAHEDEEQVEDIYFNKKYANVGWERTGKLTSALILDHYRDGIIDAVDAESIRDKKFKVVADCGCGAGAATTPFILQELGCSVLAINAQLDGTFPARNPEPTREALTELVALVKETGADIGLAHDGDADRVVFVDENGNFVDEEVLLAMMGIHVLKHSSAKDKKVVTPISSSLRIRDVTQDAGGELIWTAVGSIYVARTMRETGAVFGGEGNGGLVFPEHQYCRDGAMTMAKVLEAMAQGRKLSEIAAEVPEYVNAKTKIGCTDLGAVMSTVKGKIAGMVDVGKSSDTDGDQEQEQNTDTIIEIDDRDGLKYFYTDGWVLIRPSGTEPIIRIYAESKSSTRANELMEKAAHMVDEANSLLTA